MVEAECYFYFTETWCCYLRLERHETLLWARCLLLPKQWSVSYYKVYKLHKEGHPDPLVVFDLHHRGSHHDADYAPWCLWDHAIMMPVTLSFSDLTLLCSAWLNFCTPFSTIAHHIQPEVQWNENVVILWPLFKRICFFLLSCFDECIIHAREYLPCYFSVPQVSLISLSHMTKLH